MDPTIAAAFYNAAGVAPRNDPASPESTFAVDRVREPLGTAIRPGDRILEIGCGAGRFCFAAEQMGAEVVGIDVAEVPLAHARQLATLRGSRANFLLGDAMELSDYSGHFDLILMMNNLIEFSYPEMECLAKNFTMLLKDQGRLAICMRDEAERAGSGRGYDPETGKMRCSYEIPGRGRFDYDTHFWTVGFLIHVLLPRFTCRVHTSLADQRHWLMFSANSGI